MVQPKKQLTLKGLAAVLCPVPMAAGFCPGFACNEVFVTTFTPADVGTGDVNGVTDGFHVDPPLNKERVFDQTKVSKEDY